MRNIHYPVIVLFILLLVFPLQVEAQDGVNSELPFEVNRAHPIFSINKEQVKEAQTLIDLYPYYKADWVKEYIGVEVLASIKGTPSKEMGENNTLNQKQIDLINRADVGKSISVKVRYMPKNNLTHNDPKEINFKFTVDPESGATYVGGEQKLRQYLKEQAIDKIAADYFEGYDLTAINFTINEKGQVTDAKVHESLYHTSKFEKVDQILLKAIYNMPDWKPAQYTNGVKVKQEFVLTVGNMQNCIVNLLQIRKGVGDDE